MGVHSGVDDPRGHAVHRDAGGPQLPCQGLGKADDAGLGGGVGRLAGGPRPAPHGGDGDDAPGLPGHHVAVHRPAAVEDAVQVGPHQCPPVPVAHVTEETGPGPAGVAYQNVKLTKILQHIVNHCPDLLRVGHVGPDGHGGVAGSGELGGEGQGLPFGGMVVDGHGVAGGGKGPGGGGADAPAGPGDEDGLSVHGGLLSPRRRAGVGTV